MTSIRVTIDFGDVTAEQRNAAFDGFLTAAFGAVRTDLNGGANPAFNEAASRVQINERDIAERITRSPRQIDFLVDTAKSFIDVARIARTYFGINKVKETGSQSLRCTW